MTKIINGTTGEMNVIIIGGNRNNALGLVWSLGEAGHNVTLLLNNEGKDNYVNKSKYVNRTVLLDDGDDVYSVLMKTILQMDSKPVVFADSDHKSAMINDHFAKLSEYCFFEGGGPDGRINLYRNKDVEESLAIKCGFIIPKTVVITKPEELYSVTLSYPLFIKVNNSVHGGKKATRKCDSQLEAEVLVNNLPQEYFPLQIQEFIDKEYELMLLGCSLYGGKRIICPVANKKVRQYPKNTGSGSYSYSIAVSDSEELQQLATKVGLYMQEINYTGNFSAEFLYDNGKFIFLEINLRNDGTSWVSTCSGYNLPDIVCRSFVDENVSADNCTFRQKYFMDIMLDMKFVQDGSVKLSQWLKQFNRNTCFNIYNKKDKRPFFKFFLIFIKKKYARISKKISNKINKVFT